MDKLEMNEWLLQHDECMTIENYALNKFGDDVDLVELNGMDVDTIIHDGVLGRFVISNNVV